MENKFLIKFRHKSKIELEEILDNKEKYTKEALFAAKELFNNFDEPVYFAGKLKTKDTFKDDFSLIDFISRKFDPIPYLRSIKKDLLLTNLSLAFVILTINELSKFLWEVNDLFSSITDNLTIVIIIFLILNNVFYRIETGVSNNYIGRCINDFLLLFIFIVLRTGSNYIIDVGYSFPISDTATTALALFYMFMIALLFEMLVGLLNRLLQKMDIHIL